MRYFSNKPQKSLSAEALRPSALNLQLWWAEATQMAFQADYDKIEIQKNQFDVILMM